MRIRHRTLRQFANRLSDGRQHQQSQPKPRIRRFVDAAEREQYRQWNLRILAHRREGLESMLETSRQCDHPAVRLEGLTLVHEMQVASEAERLQRYCGDLRIARQLYRDDPDELREAILDVAAEHFPDRMLDL